LLTRWRFVLVFAMMAKWLDDWGVNKIQHRASYTRHQSWANQADRLSRPVAMTLNLHNVLFVPADLIF